MTALIEYLNCTELYNRLSAFFMHTASKERMHQACHKIKFTSEGACQKLKLLISQYDSYVPSVTQQYKQRTVQEVSLQSLWKYG